MVNKSALSKKLASYSAMATALLAVEKPADAQIVYHEVNPNFTITKPAGDYFLDLNNDGTYDFHFTCVVSNVSTYVSVFPNTKDKFSYYPKNYLSVAKSTTFLPSEVFLARQGNPSLSVTHFSSGEWLNTHDKYMPLKVVSGGKTYMGWARLSILVPDTDFTIKDYAYNLTPANSIIMGDMGCAYTPITPVVSLKGNDTLVSTASTSYQWYLNGAALSSKTAQNLIVSANGIYSVITTDANGCKTQSSTVNFNTCGSSHIKIIATASTTKCSSVVPYMQIDSIPYGYNLQWYRNDTALNLNLAFGINAVTRFYYDKIIHFSASYYVVGTNPLTGCNDTSNIIQYVANPLPPAPVLTQNEDTLITSVKGNYTYAWYENNTLIAGADSNYYIPDTSTSYKLTITNTTTGCSSSYDTTFNGCYFIPGVLTASQSAIGCNTDSVILHSFADTGLIYSWFVNAKSIAGANDSLYVATKTGTYYFQIAIPSQGCEVQSNSFVIDTAIAPVIPIITQNDDTISTGVYSSYQWFINSDSIPGAINEYYVTDSTGSYTVTVTNQVGCSAISTPYMITTTGIAALSPADVIKVYTNADIIYINFLTPDFLNGKIKLFNVDGEKLQEKIVANTIEQLNGEQLAKGIYFVTITKNDVRRTYKVALL